METLIGRHPVRSRPKAAGRCRDRELLRYVGRHGVVSIEHVMAAMGAGRTVSYDRVAACVQRGLLERFDLLRSEPRLLRATRAGLRFAGLGLPVAVVSAGSAEHWLRCASTAQLLGEHYGHERVLTEREIVLAEQIAERPLASAMVGTLPNGAPRMHRADLAVRPEGHPLIRPSADEETGPQGPSSPRTQGGWQGERTDSCVTRSHPTEDSGMRSVPAALIAIEVELTPKSPRRLESILRGWRGAVGARVVAEVHYHCAPGPTRRALERAVAKVYAEQFVAIAEVVPR
jgi:hypothetical protein